MTLHEHLSRLLDGDLPDDEAAVLRARIAREPAVARAWEDLRALRLDLEAMTDVPPPGDLDARVLDRLTGSGDAGESEPVPLRRRWGRWSGWAAAAAAVLLLWPRPTPALVLAEGSQWVDGDAKVLAGDAYVEVRGRAWLSVEPPRGFVREAPQEGTMNPTTHIVATLAGAAITVAVYEGTAFIDMPGDTPVEVGAGETRTVGGDGVPAGTPTLRRVVMDRAPSAPPADLEQATARIAELEATLAALQFEHGIARGQLARVEGEPQLWPDTVLDALDPDTFEDRLRSGIEDLQIGELLEVHCDEYPCVAVVRVDTPVDQAEDAMRGLADYISGDDDIGVMQLVHRTEDNGQVTDLLALAALPENHDPETARRTEFRARSAVEDHAQPGAPGTEDVDVDY